MSAGIGVAAGVAAGYLMGRARKMRLAMMIARAGLAGRLGDRSGELLRRGAAQFGVSEAAEGLKGAIGGDLMALDERMTELREHFGLGPEDLNIDLGPLGTPLP
ncbi:MAG TPA: gas vesicle protein GvpK [Actinospica sp.]|nr:gas vesicle protein GvpK [Actinospica sp.]